ncbi:MAG: HAD family hydrolase [Clostridia bacterium]|nr:HAD family hydrolase [Clostridia bacterium]
MIKVVLFDLDGTLLPMEAEKFAKCYFSSIAARLSQFGYDPNAIVQMIWAGTKAMIKNDGAQTNEAVFWNTAAQMMGEGIRAEEPRFNLFYIEDFDKVQASCGYNEAAAKAVREIKGKGYRVALATNPIFPAIATQKRIRWAGLSTDDFELVTTYENSRHCKPNLDYYKDIMAQLGVCGEECLMVGNDVGEDMIAEKLGMKVFLITDCMINRAGADISVYPHGSFEELLDFLK